MSTFSTSSRQKRLKTLSFLHFWLRNVLRATTACTFSTFFRHLNLQKWSEPLVFLTFWLGNVLRATTACTFSTSQLPKVVRSSSVLSILTWKCASRHNGVHFFMSHLASWLRTRRFSEPTFRPSGATNHWKNTVNRDFPTFSRICIFFLLIFSLLTLVTSAFQLSILSEVSLLNFLRLNGYNWEYTLFSDKPICYFLWSPYDVNGRCASLPLLPQEWLWLLRPGLPKIGRTLQMSFMLKYRLKSWFYMKGFS